MTKRYESARNYLKRKRISALTPGEVKQLQRLAKRDKNRRRE